MYRAVLLFAALMLVACSPTSITISIGATPTSTLTSTPEVISTPTPDTTAQAQASVIAQTKATEAAQSRGTATAAAATAQANATGQARTAATAAAATAQANATATAQSATAATRTVILAYVDALVTKAGRAEREPQGELTRSRSFWVNGNWKNFVLDVQLFNPGDPSVHSWDYGLRFRSSRAQYFDLYLRSSGTWLLQYPKELQADRVQMNQVGTGKIDSMDLSPTGSNKMRFVSYENSGFLYVNGAFIAMMDLSAIPSAGDLNIATGMLLVDDFPGMIVLFKNLSVAGLP